MNPTTQATLTRRFLLALTLGLATAPAAWSQTTTAPKDDPATAKNPVPVEAGPAKSSDEALVLSPFVVTTDKDTGYYAQNTLAGSRMRTNLADLGAAISVVTKAQMEDFASVDLNDAFRYEVNTEGSGTYTPATQAFRNDGILDVNAGGTQGNNVASLTNATANRVRGIGSPSAAINYFPSIAALPPDAYNIEYLEISRGPNSMLFGLGSPAGIANSATMQAALNKDTNRVQVRTDDRGSFRSSLSLNRVLIKDKLAVAGAFLYEDKQFERKPSFDLTKREYAAITYKPFPKTTLRANFENYDNANRRPNTISPIDYITQWNLAGKPTYDALTKKVTLLATGKTYGPYISSASSPFAQTVRDALIAMPNYNPALRGTSATAFGGTDTTFSFYNGQPIYSGTFAQMSPVLSLSVPDPAASALYVPGLALINQGRAVMQIGNGQLQNWYLPLFNTTYTTAYAIPGVGGTPAPPNVNNPISNIWNNLASSDVFDRATFASTGWTNNSFTNNLGNYRYPGVTSRAIYDWKKVNILQADYGSQKNKNYQLDFEQQLLGNLFLNGGWFRQEFKQSSNYTIGQLNAVALRVDENKYLPNGTANPFFGLPFVQDTDPDRYVNSQRDDHFRAMLAWTPDFTQKSGWMKWLGHHQVLGLWSRDESRALAERMRLNYVNAGSLSAAVRFVANPTNNADGTRTGWNFGGATQRLYYLANPGDPMGKVSSASGEWNADTYTGNIQVYNYLTNTFENANVTEKYNVAVTDPARTQRTLQSWSGGITDYFWNDRLVTTFGARLDKFKARGSTSGAITLADGTVIPALTPQQKFLPTGYYDYSAVWNRFNAWNRTTGRTKTGGGVLTPFRNWDGIERRAESGSQFWQVVRSFGVVYNWSNNFDAPSGPQVDAFGKQLPNPQGIGRDFGFQFAALDNKLFARVTWFRSTNQNQRLSAGTAIGRLTAQVPITTPDSAAASVDALFKTWARAIAKINLGFDPLIDNPAPTLSPQQELDIETAAEKIWGLPYKYYENLPGAITATGDAVSTGMEFQLNYNTRNWRNRFTFGKQVTSNSNVLKQFDAWYAARNPVWAAAKAATYLLPQYQSLATYTTASGTQVNLTNFLPSYGYNSTVRINNASGGQSVQDWININLTPQVQLSKDLDGQEAPGQRKYRWAFNSAYDFTSGRLKGFGLGGAQRWEDKSIIGYYGRSSHGNAANPNLIDISDVTRPIYDKANAYTDLFVNYKRRIWHDRVAMNVQLNVENVFENGHLQLVGVNYDGSPYGYRIIDSRKFTLTTTFDF
ncbi:MAG: TonB-dependent receptor plug domain-containing protein [bacterium]|nr:TonB-dependent receptor plug domain-containing protein [bacterium]